jgi:hypothetical protein
MWRECRGANGDMQWNRSRRRRNSRRRIGQSSTTIVRPGIENGQRVSPLPHPPIQHSLTRFNRRGHAPFPRRPNSSIPAVRSGLQSSPATKITRQPQRVRGALRGLCTSRSQVAVFLVSWEGARDGAVDWDCDEAQSHDLLALLVPSTCLLKRLLAQDSAYG